MSNKQNCHLQGISFTDTVELTWCTPPVPDPRGSVDNLIEQARQARQAAKQARAKLCQQGYEFAQDYVSDPSLDWKWYDARFVISVAMGAEEPDWDAHSNCWWLEKNNYAWSWVQSPSDVAKIKMPDWSELPQIDEMVESRQRWKTAFPKSNPIFPNIRESMGSDSPEVGTLFGYPAFLDLGIFLINPDRFLTILATEPELADALMDKCFELSVGYTDFLIELSGRELQTLAGFGADATCMLSPKLYEKYGKAWDARLFEYVKNKHLKDDSLPCNLHSCGPSDHLYQAWSEHPCLENIELLQTRLIDGKVGQLRASMPNTFLQLTICPPQFDLVGMEPKDIERLVHESAQGSLFRDATLRPHVIVHKPTDLERMHRNIRAFHQALENI